METTIDLLSLNYVGMLMDLLVQNMFSLAIATCGCKGKYFSELSATDTILGQGCLKVLKAGHFFQLPALNGNV
ncbi:hypothetical protein DPMN_050216 [Dreissena polymorpha]|uniref:Uncharacterized protein n=1 Tax=Dreissena polymorpha TaxID=45954 RepID=A0A9D4CFP9_DREPO|nr:hypothetical protein DPMN_050216 [Dreissena polymorpha]